MTLPLLFDDPHCVVVHKPAGLLVHRSHLDPSAQEFLLQKVRDLVGSYVYPVHRLDRPTAGCVLFAKDKDSAKSLGLAFDERRVRKVYLAVVRGFAEDEGQITHALKEKNDRGQKVAKSAHTDYKKLQQIELPHAVGPYQTARYSLLRVEPKTGRRHQIRRHLANINRPIIGDTSYGDIQHNVLFRQHYQLHRLLLFAQQLTFPHPVSNREITIKAELDHDWQRLFEDWQWT